MLKTSEGYDGLDIFARSFRKVLIDHKMQALVLALPLCALEQVPEVPRTSVCTSVKRIHLFVSLETWSEFGWKFVILEAGYKRRG